MFTPKTYVFEHPTENKVETITRRSYIFAGLFGAFYVLFRGFVSRFFLALAIDALFLLVEFFLLVAVASILGGAEVIVILLFILLGLLVVRALIIIPMVKASYQERGWMTMRT